MRVLLLHVFANSWYCQTFIANLVSVQWIVIVVLIYISLIIEVVCHDYWLAGFLFCEVLVHIFSPTFDRGLLI